MTHSLRVAKICTTHPLHKAQNLLTHPLSPPDRPPPPHPHILFWPDPKSSLTLSRVDMNKTLYERIFGRGCTNVKFVMCVRDMWVVQSLWYCLFDGLVEMSSSSSSRRGVILEVDC